MKVTVAKVDLFIDRDLGLRETVFVLQKGKNLRGWVKKGFGKMTFQ